MKAKVFACPGITLARAECNHNAGERSGFGRKIMRAYSICRNFSVIINSWATKPKYNEHRLTGPKTMQISITSAEEFESLLNALASEIVDAQIYFKLHTDLMAAVPDYAEVFNESNTFWWLTLHALLDTTLFRLCRIYDQHSKSLNLRNLLDTIQASLNIFDIQNFRERLKDNPFVESLSQTARKPSTDTLKQDIRYASPTNPLVRKLVIWRNNIFAHRSATNVVTQRNIADYYPLSKNDVSELLNGATSILNRYSSLFRASSYSTQIVGCDDYLYVLKTIKTRIRQHKEEIASEIARLRQADSTQRSGEVS